MSATIEVSFACNDSRGAFTGRCAVFEFDSLNDSISKCCLTVDSEIGLEFLSELDLVRVGTERLPVVNYSRARHVGNLAWDSIRMAPGEARRLAEYLICKHEAQWNELDYSELGKFIERTCQAKAKGLIK